ncbi:monosaccharide transporter [Coprinopsis cinerea okayama7|uniref:Monosaccharide transporter n=1 Tax=Coprinopsis cinerea (strain Okayama-7 / 130 / ATCC MYA-4618 / FGSC 9003) TaxID=240176 RepID=A8P252_COPC7|nr:monosaccharide transporter [Coprinopsis cinerea okayama7\|eukprot:XP_001838247.1 monosaccharide transporter [Coprinopsis cinerea okayama7\
MPLFYLQGMPIGGVSLMLACVASIGGFIFGYDTGQISDILVMDDFRQRFGNCTNPSDPSTCEFTNVRAGLIVSLLSIGTLSGALAGAVIADFLGRRWAMISECLLFCVGLIIQMTTFTVWQQVAVGRFVAGLAIGALSAAVPMYQAETAPTQLRGTLTATYQLFITAGILAAYSIGIGTRDLTGAAQWKTLIGIGFAWPALLIFGMLFMPESPRWLAAKGRSKEAARAIARTYGIPQKEADSNRFVQAEVDEIINQLEAERRLKAGWIDCFRTNNMTLYRTILGMSLQSLQQLTGANYFFYYGATIFRGVGIADSFVSQIILGAVNFGCTFGGLYVMERFGRRLPLIWGGLWQALWLFVFAAAGTARDPLYNESVGKLMITSACLFILGYATTWGPGIWILIGETFPTRTRAKQGALATASNWTWNFLISFFTPFITSSIGFRYGFVFAACNLTGAVVVYFFLYESSNLSLESVDNMYNDPDCKAWNSRHWVPAGYSSRFDLVEQTKAAQARKPFAKPQGDEQRMEKAGDINSEASSAASAERGEVVIRPISTMRARSRSQAFDEDDDVDREHPFVDGHGPGSPGYPVRLTQSGPRGGGGIHHEDGHGNY